MGMITRFRLSSRVSPAAACRCTSPGIEFQVDASAIRLSYGFACPGTAAEYSANRGFEYR